MLKRQGVSALGDNVGVDWPAEKSMSKSSNVTRRTAIRVAIAGAAAAAAGAARAPQGAGDRERVQGIGGFFFRAKDPKKLACAWYGYSQEDPARVTPESGSLPALLGYQSWCAPPPTAPPPCSLATSAGSC